MSFRERHLNGTIRCGNFGDGLLFTRHKPLETHPVVWIGDLLLVVAEPCSASQTHPRCDVLPRRRASGDAQTWAVCPFSTIRHCAYFPPFPERPGGPFSEVSALVWVGERFLKSLRRLSLRGVVRKDKSICTEDDTFPPSLRTSRGLRRVAGARVRERPRSISSDQAEEGHGAGSPHRGPELTCCSAGRRLRRRQPRRPFLPAPRGPQPCVVYTSGSPSSAGAP